MKANFETEAEPIRINHVSQANDPLYQMLDQKFPNLSNPTFRVKEVDHGVFHSIPTEGPPVQSRHTRAGKSGRMIVVPQGSAEFISSDLGLVGRVTLPLGEL